MTRVAIDTNVLAYSVNVHRHADDAAKIEASLTLLERLRERAIVIVPLQVLGELFSVLTRHGQTREFAREVVLAIADDAIVVDSTRNGLLSALDLAAAHKLQFWDSLILNAAAEAGCAMLLSEDMGDGFSWHGTTIVNPFSEVPDKRLSRLLA